MTLNFVKAVAASVLLMCSTAAVHAEDGTLRVGIITDMSGQYADGNGKGSVIAAQMAAEEIGGSVNGRKIEIISGDHQNKPDVATGIVRDWIDNKNIDVVAEGVNSAVALAVQNLTRERKKIFLISGAGSSDITGKQCSPTSIQWTYHTYAAANGTAKAIVRRGGDSWFFLTADYAFGYSLEKDTGDIVKAKGGKVLGAVRHPLNSSDFSSFLLQAQASKAKVIGLANAGLDTTNAVKQAAEFGIVAGGQKLAGLLMTLSEVHGLGLQAAQGLVLTESFYWDRDDKSREFAERFFKRTQRMPNMIQAGTYSSTLSYLKAVKAAGTKDSDAVAKKLKELPVDDAFAQNGKVQANGRMVKDLYLFEVKKPADSKRPWDYYKQLAVVPAASAYPSAKDSGCALTK